MASRKALGVGSVSSSRGIVTSSLFCTISACFGSKVRAGPIRPCQVRPYRNNSQDGPAARAHSQPQPPPRSPHPPPAAAPPRTLTRPTAAHHDQDEGAELPCARCQLQRGRRPNVVRPRVVVPKLVGQHGVQVALPAEGDARGGIERKGERRAISGTFELRVYGADWLVYSAGRAWIRCRDREGTGPFGRGAGRSHGAFPCRLSCCGERPEAPRQAEAGKP